MTHTETAERAEDVPASQAARTASWQSRMREAGEPDPEEEVPEDGKDRTDRDRSSDLTDLCGGGLSELRAVRRR